MSMFHESAIDPILQHSHNIVYLATEGPVPALLHDIETINPASENIEAL
jgi:hypothetical protein